MSHADFVQMDPRWRDRYEALYDWTWPLSFSLDQRARLPFPHEWEHVLGLAAGERLAAVTAFYPFPNLPIPGGRIQANGLTSVTVHPNHRRQGLLRRLIGRYLEVSLGRGDLFSVLMTQDYPIYGRFGFGHVSNTYNLRIPHGTRLIAPAASQIVPAIDFDYADPERDAPFIHRVQSAQTRPGTPTREARGFQHRALTSEPAPAQPLRILRVEVDHEPAAYALYTRPHEGDLSRVAPVIDWNAVGAVAEYALWQALVDQDLVSIVEAQRVPVDAPLVFMLPDPRAASPALHDDMFARILDLPACLAARAYSADLDLTLQVADALIPANDGQWRLRVAGGVGEATRIDVGARVPDLSLTISQLSAAYLGRPVLAGQARAGQIAEHVDGALDALHRAMTWPVQPAATWLF